MENSDISTIFRNISTLMQIRGDNAFRARVYERAADMIDGLPSALTDCAAMMEEFLARPGIGKAIQDKTVEMLNTGRCKFYDELTGDIGIEVLELLNIRGIGVKTAARLYHELGIRNLDNLANALEKGQLRGMKGIGKKTSKLIADGLLFHSKQKGTRPLVQALKIAEQIADGLKTANIQPFQFTGELRRYEEICQRLELIVQYDDNGDTIQNSLIKLISQTLGAEPPQNGTAFDNTIPTMQFRVTQDFPVLIYLCTPEEYNEILFLTTGTDKYLRALQQLAVPAEGNRPKKSLTGGARPKSRLTGLYQKTRHFPHIPPELQQDETAVKASLEGTLPNLVEFGDLRGDLHAHTHWSDGRNTIKEMIEAAKAEGLEYIAITEHSVSSTVANGLNQERLMQQIARLRELNAQTEGITVLAGSEVDIRQDGRLDFSKAVLAQLDIVVASVHSHFSLSEARMTQRLICAIENPFVNIIGHPTGRLLGTRTGYALNLEDIIEAAAENSTVLEINGSPKRLDLGPEWVRRAKMKGVRLAVNTDAHAIEQLEHRRFGINVARRGWLTKQDVINTYTLDALKTKCGIGTTVS